MNGTSVPLTQNQFDVLFSVFQHGGQTQREIGESTGLGLGTVNAAVRECAALGLIEDKEITVKGLEALQPYRVDNAVIMAAGMSQRFVPISYEKPKGLLKVKGEVLIERQIRQLQEAGISDITVVVGYKKERFVYLAQQMGVKIVVNTEYATRNNNSTLWVVREELANTYVCCSDNYFTENPFEPYVYQAYYSAEFVEGETEEWCIETGAGDRITGLEIGGSNAWVMAGHAYFDRAFSNKFKEILEKVYPHRETVGKYWEDIYNDNLSALHMVKKEYPAGYINEFDSLEQLKDFDPAFIENVDSAAFDNITSVLGTSRAEVTDFYPLKAGITNLSCHFAVDGDEYVYRHPGIGTERMIDRDGEAEALLLGYNLGLDDTYLHVDAENGWKITRFLPNTRYVDVADPDELRTSMEMDYKLHHSGETLNREFDFITEGLKYESLLERFGPIDIPGYRELRHKVLRLKDLADQDGFPKVPSHNDFCHLNLLMGEDGIVRLIDWEYAGMADEANDFGTFVIHSELDEEMGNRALSYYFGREATEVEKRNFWAHVVFAGWCWYVQALLREAEGNDVGEWLYLYYRHAQGVDRFLEMYGANSDT